jgi:hypothetical protein
MGRRVHQRCGAPSDHTELLQRRGVLRRGFGLASGRRRERERVEPAVSPLAHSLDAVCGRKVPKRASLFSDLLTLVIGRGGRPLVDEIIMPGAPDLVFGDGDDDDE